MERKQIDLAFGNVATILTLKELEKLNSEKLSNENPEYNDYFENNPLFSRTDKNIYPNLISVNFTDTIQSITGGISYIETKDNESENSKKIKVS